MAEEGLSASALVSLAIVKVNWDKASRGYSDSFMPFVAVALDACASSTSADEVRDQVASEFSIRLPQSVVLNLLERASHQGFAKREGRRRFSGTDRARSLRSELLDQRATLARRRNALVDVFVSNARDVGVELNAGDAERMLLRFIELHSAPLLAGILRGDASGVPGIESESEEFLAARFIVRVLEREPQVSDYLGDVVKGSMLAASLYSTAPGELQRKFRSTTLYLDTPLLLKALGHEGELAAVPVREMLSLARASSAHVACFEHSLHEIEGVLHGVADVLATGRRPPAVRGVLAHYLSDGASSSDVLEKIALVEERLGAIDIHVVPRPPHERDVTIDELALRAALMSRVHYSSGPAVDHDIDSLTAIHRLRGGMRVEQVERSRAVLVTDNAGLVATAARFFRSNEGAVVGPAILDHNLTTLLWAKGSQGAPELPVNQILADAYALLNPGPAMWRAYMDQIDQLSRRGEVTAEQVTELRFSMEAHRAVVADTGGDSTKVTKSVVMNALETARQAASAPERRAREVAEAETERQRELAGSLADSVAAAASEAAQLREHVRALEARAERQDRSIDKQATRDVRRGTRIALVVLALVGIASVLTAQFDVVSGPVARGLRIGGLVFAVLGLVSLVFGGSLKAVFDRFEAPLVRSRARWLRRRLHLTEEVSEEVR